MKQQFIMMAAALAVASPAVAQTAAPPATRTAPAPLAAAQTPLTEDAITALDKVCLPILRGAKVKAVGPAAGFKLRNGDWSRSIDDRQQLDLDPPDVANPHLCTITVTYAPGAGAQLRAALGGWASAQSPPLASVQVNQAIPGSDLTTSQWSGAAAGGVESLVLSQERPAQKTSGSRQSTLTVSLGPT
jgi:hypothetical protein